MILGAKELANALAEGLVELADAVGVDIAEHPSLTAVRDYVVATRALEAALARDAERRADEQRRDREGAQ